MCVECRIGMLMPFLFWVCRIYAVKKWDLIKEFSHHSATVSDFAWGQDASFLVTGALERRVCLLA